VKEAKGAAGKFGYLGSAASLGSPQGAHGPQTHNREAIKIKAKTVFACGVPSECV